MSTIASPRDTPSLRRLNTSTPTSSSRPSLDIARASSASPPSAGPPRRRSHHRAALREYYNLRTRAEGAAAAGADDSSEVAHCRDLDAPDFRADEYVARVVADSSLADLLRLYTRVVAEVRALDAEKKALVYDNYSKLIVATETIRKMRANMDPVDPMTATLDPTLSRIYSQAEAIRQAARASVPEPSTDEAKRRETLARQRKTRELARSALETPQTLRDLVSQGKKEEAKKQWELPRRLLISWKDQGVGGDDVQALIDEGDAILQSADIPTIVRTKPKNAR